MLSRRLPSTVSGMECIGSTVSILHPVWDSTWSTPKIPMMNDVELGIIRPVVKEHPPVDVRNGECGERIVEGQTRWLPSSVDLREMYASGRGRAEPRSQAPRGYALGTREVLYLIMHPGSLSSTWTFCTEHASVPNSSIKNCQGSDAMCNSLAVSAWFITLHIYPGACYSLRI